MILIELKYLINPDVCNPERSLSAQLAVGAASSERSIRCFIQLFQKTRCSEELHYQMGTCLCKVLEVSHEKHQSKGQRTLSPQIWSLTLHFCPCLRRKTWFHNFLGTVFEHLVPLRFLSLNDAFILGLNLTYAPLNFTLISMLCFDLNVLVLGTFKLSFVKYPNTTR